jgi:hypothetical protein
MSFDGKTVAIPLKAFGRMSIILVAAALEMVKTLRRSTAKSVEAN